MVPRIIYSSMQMLEIAQLAKRNTGVQLGTHWKSSNIDRDNMVDFRN